MRKGCKGFFEQIVKNEQLLHFCPLENFELFFIYMRSKILQENSEEQNMQHFNDNIDMLFDDSLRYYLIIANEMCMTLKNLFIDLKQACYVLYKDLDKH